MIVNAESLRQIDTSFLVLFKRGLDKVPPRAKLLMMDVPMKTASAKLPMGALTSQIREWIGDRFIAPMGAWLATLEPKKFEQTTGVGRDAMADDNVGVYAPVIEGMGIAMANFPLELCLTALAVNAFSAVGFDGVPFFSNSHTWKGAYETTQSNLLTAALDSTAVYTMLAAMKSFRNPQGGRLRVEPNVFWCSENLRATAEALFFLQKLSDGSDNPHFGRFARENIVIEPEFPDDHWGMMDTTRNVKPMLNLIREAPELVSQTNPKDENVFMRDEFLWGSRYRGNVVAVPWWLACASTGEAESGSGA